MPIDFSQNVFYDPVRGHYWVLQGNVQKPLSGDVTLLGGNIQNRSFGQPINGTSTSGGTISVDQYKKDVKNTFENQLPQSAIQSYTDKDIQNPNYEYVQKGSGSKLLIPQDKLQDFLSVGYQQIQKPTSQVGQSSLQNKASNQDVKQAYQQYFNRQPTTAELNNWGVKGGSDTTVEALTKFLQSEQLKYGYTPLNANQSGKMIPLSQSIQNPQIDTNQQKQWDIVTGGTMGAFTGSSEQQQVLKNAGFTSSSQSIHYNYSDLPTEVTSDPRWNLLNDNQKAVAYFQYKTQTATSEAQKKDALAALEKAKELADPYFKEQIRISQDEITRGITSTQGDIQFKLTTLNDRIKNIKEDLTYNKEQLNLEQQAEMSQQLKENEQNLFNLQQQAADAGLAFSSPRIQAEQALRTQQQGLAQSTSRKYNQALRGLEVPAERGTLEAQQAITETQRAGQEALTNLARKGEAQLGTENIPQTGITSLGEITGSLAEQNQANVLNLQKILQQRANPF